MHATVFISYSSKDQKEAELVCNALESRGFSCWIAFRDVHAGDDFQEAIVAAIERAKAMVLVFTENANNSDEIKKELVLAGQYDVVVMPVRVEDIRPRGAFAYQLATRQWIDLFDDWERGMGRLSERIAAVAGAERASGETTAAASPTATESGAPRPSPKASPDAAVTIGTSDAIASSANPPAAAASPAPRRSRRWLLLSGAAAGTAAIGTGAYWGADLVDALLHGPERTIRPGFSSKPISLSPDGRQFAAAFTSPGRYGEVWSLDTEKPVAVLVGFYVLDSLGRFSADGRWIVSHNNDNTISIRATDTGKVAHQLRGHTKEVLDAAFSPDGRWLASGGWDRIIRLWDAPTGQLVRTLSGHTEGVRALAFTPDGKRLISAGYDRTLRIWDVASGQVISTMTIEPESVEAIAVPPAGPWIALYVSFERRVRLFNVATGEVRNVRVSGPQARVAFSPDGRWLALGARPESARSEDRADIALWTADGATPTMKFVGHTHRVDALAFSSDGRHLVSAGFDNTVRVWKIPAGKTA